MAEAIGIDIGDGAWALARATVSPDGEIAAITCSCASFEHEIEVPTEAVVTIDSPNRLHLERGCEGDPQGPERRSARGHRREEVVPFERLCVPPAD